MQIKKYADVKTEPHSWGEEQLTFPEGRVLKLPNTHLGAPFSPGLRSNEVVQNTFLAPKSRAQASRETVRFIARQRCWYRIGNGDIDSEI